jgi:hypothetical protein
MSSRRYQNLLTVLAIVVAVALAGIGQAALRSGGGESVKVKITENIPTGGTGEITQESGLTSDPAAVRVGTAPVKGTGAGDPFCATNSLPEQGITDKTMKWGTIVPLTGALRPLAEQTARVMKVASETWLNSISNIPGPYASVKWGCAGRPGIFGRKISLTIYSLSQNTDTEALGGMRRLIDQEKVFLVRDCYLQSNLMGPATQYQNQKGVPGVWCSYSGMPTPQLAKWNFSPGTNPLMIAAIHMGWLIKRENRSRPALLYDPTAEKEGVAVMRRVYENLAGRSIPAGCQVATKSQDATNGMRGQIAQIRNCWQGVTPATPSPDMVIGFDVFNAAFGATAARDQGWRGADPTVNVQWACLTCWVIAIAELCADACQNMITDCQALPCIPWADPAQFPSAQVLEETRKTYFPRDNNDILTHGPAAITGGLGLWLGMTGPNLSRDALRVMFETKIKNWDAGIGPTLNITENDHYGGKSVWLIKFCGSPGCDPQGRNAWFADFTGRINDPCIDPGGFVPLSCVGVREELAAN